MSTARVGDVRDNRFDIDRAISVPVDAAPGINACLTSIAECNARADALLYGLPEVREHQSEQAAILQYSSFCDRRPSVFDMTAEDSDIAEDHLVPDILTPPAVDEGSGINAAIELTLKVTSLQNTVTQCYDRVRSILDSPDFQGVGQVESADPFSYTYGYFG